jgi:FK506-binding nuclear protein
MAAIDPTAEPETDGQGNVPSVPRSTLKIYKANVDDEEDDGGYLESLLGGGDDEEESDEEDDEVNGGPSDPSKSKKARREAAIKKLIEATQADSDDEMEDDGAKPNGAKNKGKAKASDEDEEESDEEDEEGDDLNMEEYVVCTLDTERVCRHLGILEPPFILANICCRPTNNPSISPLVRARRFSSASRALTRFT